VLIAKESPFENNREVGLEAAIL